jgi:ribosome-associated toxin RatA of RatAB toxin-antitoxin module
VRPVASPFLFAVFLSLAPARAAEITVDVTRKGDVFNVEARAEFEGAAARAWQVLTDYGRYAEYIPELSESRVIARRGNQVEVEQKGEARVLFLSFPLDVKLAVTEQPFERVVSRAVSGSFREMRNVYTIEAAQGRVVLRYTGRLVPDFYVPPVIGTLLLRSNIEAMFVALVEEMERRSAPEKK